MEGLNLIFIYKKHFCKFVFHDLEADVLCDRVAIIQKGEIKCFGSPKYLKEKYGRLLY